MKPALTLGLVLALCHADLAAPPLQDVDRSAHGEVEIVDFGTYHMVDLGQVPAPGEISGEMTETESHVDLIKPGSDICAALGTAFGMRYQVSPDLDDAGWLIEDVVDTPMLHYPNGRSGTHNVLPRLTQRGEITFNIWGFDKPAELVAGDYTFSVVRNGQVMLRKTFHVRTDCEQALS